jgi:uncharacterized sporulation protein YeaH/YhbH (DUF444 family)
MRHFTTADFQRWGAQGGSKSKRTLTSEQARAMVVAREIKRGKKAALAAVKAVGGGDGEEL